MTRGRVALLVLTALLPAACGQTAPPSAPAPRPVAAPVAPPAPVAAVAPAQPAVVPAAQKYDTKGRRDPFQSLETRAGAEGPSVSAAKLTGIVRGARGPLALVETADGLGYILKPGDTLGDGRLIEIGRDSITFSVVPKPGSTTNRVVLRLPGD